MTETSELAVRRPVTQLSVSLLPRQQMTTMLAEYEDRRKCFRDWLLSQMTVGVHYGVPPGCEVASNVDPKQWKGRPSLYKAGADLICDLLKMRPTFSPDESLWKMLGAKDGTICIRCQLVNDNSPFFAERNPGDMLGEGHGAGHAGVKRRDGNGAIKIAEKSAKIDAVINTLGLSDLFTQDQEDEAQRGTKANADNHAPKVATRAERKDDNGLSKLIQKWKVKNPGKSKADFEAWGRKTLVTDIAMDKPEHWTLDAVTVCMDALQ